jgi:hypothetical protein
VVGVPLGKGVGVEISVGSCVSLGVGETVRVPGVAEVGESVIGGVLLVVAEALGVGESEGVSEGSGVGFGGAWIWVGIDVLGGEGGRVAVIVPGVLLVWRVGS